MGGVGRPGIAQLNGDGHYVRLSGLTPTGDGSIRVRITSQPWKSYLLQASSDLQHWIDLYTRLAGGFPLHTRQVD